jgi:hypothetical protein
MILSTNLGKQATILVAFLLLLLTSATSFAQTPPALGTASTYGAFSGNGAIDNTGLTIVNGDIGTYVGSFTGFPPGIYTGTKNVANAAALTAKNDLTLAYNSLNDATHAVIFDTAISATMGNGQVLTPRTYGRSDITTLAGTLTFDAKGNTAAVFIIKIRAAFNVSAKTKIQLTNGAQAANIYWAVDGAVSILDSSTFKGTILSNGSIHLYTATMLEGRALAVVGAITLASSIVTMPVAVTNSLVIITPAKGDTIKGGTQNYQITWSGTGIQAHKTFEFSLDSGLTWTLIDTINSATFTHNWNVPDTASKKALVRITDANNLRGVSGLFVITSSKSAGTLVVVRPALGEIITGGTMNYQITWTGAGINAKKTLALSLDSGLTWTPIGTLNADVMSYSWNVPDTASTKALVRVTDSSGTTGTSGLFTIKSSKGTTTTIVVVKPALGEVINGGTQNYQITFTATNATPLKRFEYSLDGGANWTLIGSMSSNALAYTWPNVPNVATTQALVRITDSLGATGTSGLFTINKTPGSGSIDAVTLSGLDSKNNIDNNKSLGISWSYTGDIGTTVEVEYSFDGITWNHIATLPVTDQPSTTWMTPVTGSYPTAYIRVTSSKGMTKTSAPFSIGLTNAVSLNAATSGYSVSNYPNPATDRMMINFVIPVQSEVSITITDALGRAVGTIDAKHFNAGNSSISLNTAKLAAGMYTYTLQAGTTRIVGRMSIIR